MKKIAVIGSGSFLARNFIQYSLEQKSDFHFELYDYCERNDWSQFPFKRINFAELEDVQNINFAVDAIIIYIGKTGTTAGFENYKEYIEVNEIMLLNVLQAYKNAGSRARIIYPSSRLTYKSNEKGMISEDSERECRSIYAVTKMAAEQYIKIYRDTFGAHSVIIRICTPIGSLCNDFGNYGTFEIFKKQAIEKKEITVFGDGLQKKTFTRIEDICKAFSLLVEKEDLLYDEYNLGGQTLSLLDVANNIAEEYNVPVRHIEWPQMHKSVDGGSIVFNSERFDKEFLIAYGKVIE